jgi:hypothetical protein
MSSKLSPFSAAAAPAFLCLAFFWFFGILEKKAALFSETDIRMELD